MKTKDVNDLANKLDENSRGAILELIDLKSDNDMKELVAQIKILDNHMNTSLAALNSNVKTELAALDSNLRTEINTVNSRVGNMYWFIIGIGTVISILLAIVALKK